MRSGTGVVFGPRLWALLAYESTNGLLLAAVLKYADAIMKNYANAMAVFVTAALSHLLFAYEPTWHFVVGGALVVVSVPLYNSVPHVKKA